MQLLSIYFIILGNAITIYISQGSIPDYMRDDLNQFAEKKLRDVRITNNLYLTINITPKS